MQILFVGKTHQRYPSMFIEILKAFLIGLVEGLTEWLPISSTGHMILVDEFVHLDVSTAFLELFLVVIQIGAIMAVIILYFTKLNPFSRKKTKAERGDTWRLWGMVVIGCLPAAVIGILFDDWVTEHMHNAWVVAAMLIVYGVVFIILERRNRREYVQFVHDSGRLEHKPSPDEMFDIKTVDEIDWKAAIKIGLFQCLAIIPGTSRSGATIIGGMLTGCSRTAAAEFTFFLAIPIMFGWGIVKAFKTFFSAGLIMTSTEVTVLIVGIITAFAVSIVSIKFLMGYIKNNDFAPFGVYRIIVGVVVLGFFGIKLFMAV
jgi:undecaprenyl-diphosphatase